MLRSRGYASGLSAKNIWNVGDRVKARWKDCKLYPAKVVELLELGKVKIRYYDGIQQEIGTEMLLSPTLDKKHNNTNRKRKSKAEIVSTSEELCAPTVSTVPSVCSDSHDSLHEDMPCDSGDSHNSLNDMPCDSGDSHDSLNDDMPCDSGDSHDSLNDDMPCDSGDSHDSLNDDMPCDSGDSHDSLNDDMPCDSGDSHDSLNDDMPCDSGDSHDSLNDDMPCDSGDSHNSLNDDMPCDSGDSHDSLNDDMPCDSGDSHDSLNCDISCDSDDSYEPSDEEVSSDSDDSHEPMDEEMSCDPVDGSQQTVQTNQVSSISVNAGIITNNILIKAAVNRDETGHISNTVSEETGQRTNESDCRIKVMPTSNIGKTRKWDKKHFCYLCCKPQAQIARHLKSKHSDNTEIAKLLLENDQLEKDKQLRKLRNLGNHIHNCSILRSGKGLLIVAYRPSHSVSPYDYNPCQHCYGYFSRGTLWKHIRGCSLRDTVTRKYSRVLGKSTLLLPSPTGVTSNVMEVLSVMRNDAISRAIKGDGLILKLAQSEYTKNGHDKEKHPYIRNRVREVGRFLVALREKCSNKSTDLSQFIDPAKFQESVEAVKLFAGYDSSSHSYTAPSLVLKIGHSLRKCAMLLKGIGLESGDHALVERCSDFDTLCELKWSEEITRSALRNLREKKRNKVKYLPLTEDIVTLSTYLRNQAGEHRHILENPNDGNSYSSRQSWNALNEVALTQIILFNRRRQGEASKMTIEDFGKVQSGDTDSDAVKSLTNIEQELCKRLTRVEIVGKRGRTVPIIFTEGMKKTLDCLLATRNVSGVGDDNDFMFPRSHYGSTSHIRGCDTLRKLAILSGTSKPNAITSTSLRKHVATITQIINLSNNELDIIAGFLGHDINIHREYYRLPQQTLQVAKVSKILLAMERGTICDHSGETLDQISVTLEDEIEHSDADDTADESDDGAEEKGRSLSSTGEAESNKDTAVIERSLSSTGEAESNEDTADDCSGLNHESEITEELPHVKARRKRCHRKPWMKAEKDAVLKHVNHLLLAKKLPGKAVLEDCIKKEKILSRRSWQNLKDFCRNLLKNMFAVM